MGGVRTSMMPSRWPETPTRDPRPGRFLEIRLGITNGVLRRRRLRGVRARPALRIAEEVGDDNALGLVKYILGFALVLRDGAADHQRGLDLLAQVRDMCLHGRFYRSELRAFEFHAARERARRGDRDGAIPVIRNVLDDFFENGQLAYGAAGTALLVQTLRIVAARVTWPKPKPRSTVRRSCRPTKDWCYATSRCCRCALCWPALEATMSHTATW